MDDRADRTEKQADHRSNVTEADIERRNKAILDKLEKRPGDLTKGELRKIVGAYKQAQEKQSALLHRIQQENHSLKAEIEEARARVCRYAEEAMHQRDQREQRDPDVVLGFADDRR